MKIKMSLEEVRLLFENYPDAKVKRVGNNYYLDSAEATRVARHTGQPVIAVTKEDIKPITTTTKKVSDGTK